MSSATSIDIRTAPTEQLSVSRVGASSFPSFSSVFSILKRNLFSLSLSLSPICFSFYEQRLTDFFFLVFSIFEYQVLQEQLKHDLNMCAESIQKLQQAVGKYHTSGMACEALNEEEVGTPMLVPVTESLYVPGKVGATDKVLVDIGTGYFVEKTPKGAEEYCKKKVQELRVNMERIMSVVQQKRKQLVMVSEQLSKRGQ